MDDRDQSLMDRAERLFAGRPVGDAQPKIKAIIGPAGFPAAETLANAALEALRNARTPTPRQRAALERMIAILRPSVLVKDGQLGDLPTYTSYPAGTEARWDEFRRGFRPFAYSVGRIDWVERFERGGDQPVGTGFLVAPQLLVTNRHVLEKLSASTMELEEGQAVVRFRQEYDTVDGDPPVPITGVAAVHDTLDMALLVVAPQAGRPPLPIADTPASTGDAVVAVGYPCRDDQRNPVFADRIFENRYDVKRGAPGEVVGTGADALYHDCSTLGGSSGSPLLTLGDRTRVVGLHRDGPLFMYRNESVDAAALAAFVRTARS